MPADKKRGRPSKAPIEGERNSLGLRVTAELKRRIENAAKLAGRSQSQEAEYRLEQSFLYERHIRALEKTVFDMDQRASDFVRRFGGAARLNFAANFIEKLNSMFDNYPGWRGDETTNSRLALAMALTVRNLMGKPSKISIRSLSQAFLLLCYPEREDVLDGTVFEPAEGDDAEAQLIRVYQDYTTQCAKDARKMALRFGREIWDDLVDLQESGEGAFRFASLVLDVKKPIPPAKLKLKPRKKKED